MIIKNQYIALEGEKKAYFSQEDTPLLEPFSIPSSFDVTKNTIELHVYDLTSQLLFSTYDYKQYTVSTKSIASPTNITILSVDPVEDIKTYGFEPSDVKLVYNFINKLTDTKGNSRFFIKEISPNRTELRISSTEIEEDDQIEILAQIRNNIESDLYTQLTALNFFDNNFVPIVNTVSFVEDETVLAVKLYTPLPSNLGIKDEFELVEYIADSVEYEVQNNVIIEEEPLPVLRGPNFDINLSENFSNPTELLSSEDIISSITGSSYKSYYETSFKSAAISTDYTDYKHFIHFSSAEERLKNFKYKLRLLEEYEVSKSLAESIQPLSQATASISFYNNLIESIVVNFDGYENYLYFESSSKSWPKTTSTEPYINASYNSSPGLTFYNSELTSASRYDENNVHRLLNAVPRYVVENPDNAPYNLFIDMTGQHFDNLWEYTKAVSDRYDGDNRLDKGISRDLVGEALKAFGIKIYGSNATLDNLFSMFSGEVYQTGSEQINTFVTSSLAPISKNSYQEEVLKRVYHNVPLLLKSKGTERGIKALISTFGIPSNLLPIRYYGGINTDSTPFYGPYFNYTSSLDRIRFDNTGSIVEGNTLSIYNSIVKEDNKYTQDLHSVEIGFSPANNIDEYIISASLVGSNFNIDDYIGDPEYFYSSSYDNLDKFTLTALSGSFTQKYNVYDLARIVKFYDNKIFKMIKDFTPGRANVTTGIIIKPHLLDRSKVRRIKSEAEQAYYTGSRAIGTIRGGSGGSLASLSTFYETGFTYFYPLPSGSFSIKTVKTNEPRITGELSGSQLTLTTGELNPDNPIKKNNKTGYSFRIRPVNQAPPDITFSVTVTHISP